MAHEAQLDAYLSRIEEAEMREDACTCGEECPWCEDGNHDGCPYGCGIDDTADSFSMGAMLDTIEAGEGL